MGDQFVPRFLLPQKKRHREVKLVTAPCKWSDDERTFVQCGHRDCQQTIVTTMTIMMTIRNIDVV
jgi:hypothetical protein